METIFVTGAEGFAGRWLIQQFRQRGFRVVAGVRNRARKLAYERQHGKALVCDVSDPISVARAIASTRPDGIVHLAAVSVPAAADEQPLTAYQSIVSGWANVLDAVRRMCPRARVLLISAADVYGDAGADGRPLPETTPTHPVTTFGSLKLAAEAIAHTFFKKYHLDLTIARPFHYAGPGQPEHFFLAAAARRLAGWDPAITGEELVLPDLDCRRDVLHVQDLADAYERLLLNGKPNETYNVCSGRTHTCRELVQMLADAAHLPVQLIQQPAADGSPPEIPTLCGDNTRLRTDLGWQPTRTAEAALQELLRSFQRPAPAPQGVA